MEYADAIRILEEERKLYESDYCTSGDGTPDGTLMATIDEAIEALKKQIPKKPILKSRTEVIHLNKDDEPHEWREIKRQDWVCPVCGCFVGQGHNAFQIKPHDQRKYNYCNECGQAINWEGMEGEE